MKYRRWNTYLEALFKKQLYFSGTPYVMTNWREIRDYDGWPL